MNPKIIRTAVALQTSANFAADFAEYLALLDRQHFLKPPQRHLGRRGPLEMTGRLDPGDQDVEAAVGRALAEPPISREGWGPIVAAFVVEWGDPERRDYAVTRLFLDAAIAGLSTDTASIMLRSAIGEAEGADPGHERVMSVLEHAVAAGINLTAEIPDPDGGEPLPLAA